MGCLGASRGVGCQGCIGVVSGLGAQPHLAPVQGPSTPTGSPGGVTYLAKAKQVTEMSSADYYIHFELYFVTVFIFYLCHLITYSSMDYFLCRPIYAYCYTINVTYYDTMVLITNNYFSHQISDLVHLPWAIVHSSICDTDLV